MHATYGIPKVDNVLTSRHDSQVVLMYSCACHLKCLQVVSRKVITGSNASHLTALPSTNRKTSTVSYISYMTKLMSAVCIGSTSCCSAVRC